jgi:hypothetical protein
MAKFKIKYDHSKCYVYYNRQTGQIMSVGVEPNPHFEHYIIQPFELVEQLISGRRKFSEFVVSYKKSVLAVVEKDYEGYVFKNNLYEWLKPTDEQRDCIVEWNQKDHVWRFKLDNEYKELINERLLNQKLLFFVTLATDFDFLIRTIPIDVVNLVSEKFVEIPFVSNLEQDIKKISISCKMTFKNYGLRIVHE